MKVITSNNLSVSNVHGGQTLQEVVPKFVIVCPVKIFTITKAPPPGSAVLCTGFTRLFEASSRQRLVDTWLRISYTIAPGRIQYVETPKRMIIFLFT